MRLLAFLILPAMAFAAPVPIPAEKPTVELKLSADSQNELMITIRNTGKETLEMPYRATPFEHLIVELHGDQGKKYKIEQKDKDNDKAVPGTLSIPAGESKTLSLHTCHYLPRLGEPGQKVTFLARLKLGEKTIESEPLTMNP